MKIFNKFKVAFLSKAYTEGIYADTPANRKLGRVGMSYAEYAAKQKGEEEKSVKLKDFEEHLINDDNQIKLTYTEKGGDKRVGEIVIFKEPEERTLYLEHISVYGDYKRKGLGRQILKKGLQLSNKESDKFDKIQLWVDNADNQFTQDAEEQKKNNQYLVDFYKSEGFDFQFESDKDALNPNMEKKLKKSFTIEQVKEKVQSEIKKLKRKNDYVTISDSSGNTYRFSYNRNADEDAKGFNECLVKNKKGQILKTFKNSHEEDLMNSVHKYIQSLGVDIIPVESGGNEDVSSEHNTAAIKKKMQEAKDSQTGTILVKGSGDKLIYLNRERKGRWLKDFNAYTIRDSKRNIIAQGKAGSEEELTKKLNEYLSKNKIKLEI